MLRGSDRYTLLEVYPKTGRHHQIRVQLSKMGCSIKGDLKYGAPRNNEDASIHLHARSLEFEHPVTKVLIKVTAKVPMDNLWQEFDKMMR
jgi:23S rRNA pseudouridine1911/1915/1917 synthase